MALAAYILQVVYGVNVEVQPKGAGSLEVKKKNSCSNSEEYSCG